jgi:hypothetical protein
VFGGTETAKETVSLHYYLHLQLVKYQAETGRISLIEAHDI